MIKVGIVGGTGYTGVELLRLLAQHPNVQLHRHHLAQLNPACRWRRCSPTCAAASISPSASRPWMRSSACDVVFFATPHGVAMKQTPELLERGVKVIDLGADFRLKDLAAFEKWYGMPHSCPDILEEAVYGLPEVNREAIRTARVIGNPGATLPPSNWVSSLCCGRA
jgi:N-acetyl-gamma-glutamyl-phosphate reductase